MTPPAFGPIFAIPQALPRGPHRLTRGQVAASQRSRLMVAIADAVAEHGYAAATISDISKRAGVSPKTFYQHFTDKLDCFLAAYDTFAGVLLSRVDAQLDDDTAWSEFVASTLDVYLGTLEENPASARAFLVEMDSAGEVARARRREAWEQFAALLRARHERMREDDASLAALPDRLYLAIVLGIRELVCDALEATVRPRLTDLVPDVLFWVTATIRGAAAAGDELAVA